MASNHSLSFGREVNDLRSKWGTLSVYERFEQSVVTILTFVIAVIVIVAAWQLLLHTLKLVFINIGSAADPQAFQSVFGMVLTVLIALEFKHTLLVVKHHRRAVVEVRAVVLIALLTLVRRFIIFDIYQASPGIIAAMAGAIVALGAVFWVVGGHQPRDQESPE
jgi:uncharacterized membrane protein (DUF373 family)